MTAGFLTEREVLAALGSGHRTASVPTVRDIAANTRQAREPELDRHTIEQALQQVGGNLTAAAKTLGISRRALYRRLDALGIR